MAITRRFSACANEKGIDYSRKRNLNANPIGSRYFLYIREIFHLSKASDAIGRFWFRF